MASNSELKHYIVTLKREEDLDDFYGHMETLGGTTHIPNRVVGVAGRRPSSVCTHYYLTDEEADLIRKDERVLGVTLTHGARPELKFELHGSTKIIEPHDWRKGKTNQSTSAGRLAEGNWGMYRCSVKTNPNPSDPSNTYPGPWGYNPKLNKLQQAYDPSLLPNKGMQLYQTGKNVDIVNIEPGLGTPPGQPGYNGTYFPGQAAYGHPEFAVNPDGTGGSRYVPFDWYTLDNAVLGYSTNQTYSYPSSKVSYHATHCTGISAGNNFGWARDANIYCLDLYINYSVYQTIIAYDYVRMFHITKPINPATGRRNPTITNNSWGAVIIQDLSLITDMEYRGTSYGAYPWTNGAPNYKMWWNDPILSRNENNVKTGYDDLFKPYNSGICSRDFAIDGPVDQAVAAGVIHVNSAGNSGWYIDEKNGPDWNNRVYGKMEGSFSDPDWYYIHRGASPRPSDYGITVGATDTDARTPDYIAQYSNSGPGVPIWAPGSIIMSSYVPAPISGGGVETLPSVYIDPRTNSTSYYTGGISGTSMAGPQVTGVLACALEAYPLWKQQDAYNYLAATASSGVLDTSKTSFKDTISLNGSPNRMLYYKNETNAGQIVGPRPTEGTTFPRPKIRQYSK